ncbi:hypothetical protein MFIFM68171_02527 [Madurella fahalii]|uniref:Uncharacterized protein n=1 Tax=Madurella fahalii TaxID=1157608 RepID=A0ABQ0G3K6_9PEZI
MNARHQRVLEWICTGRHVVEADYVKPAAGSSNSVLIDEDDDDNNNKNKDKNNNRAAQSVPDASPPSPTRLSSSASSASSSSSPISDRLIGVDDGDDDPLIPPRGGHRPRLSGWSGNDVPALPAHLPRHGHIAGRPLWHVPDPEHEGDTAAQGLDLQYLHGRRVYFHVSRPKPVECHVYSHPPLPGHDLLSAQRGLSILTLCWSYILSVRLLELQRRKPIYSQHCLLPVTAKAFKPSSGEVLLDLSASASPKLVRSHGAPDPVLCDMGYFEPEHQPEDHQPELSPATTAFLAALVLPFYRLDGLRPQFPSPILKRCSAGIAKGTTREPARIRQYAADLRYYMTLSMNTKCLGSALWSIFWQPDIETNLVSPWLSSISYVLKPVLESRNLGQLAKVFACCRPRIASWWLGIFLLGDFTILDWITRYLETLEERWGFGPMSLPDSTVAAWTGSPQSFLDDESPSPYTHPDELISRGGRDACLLGVPATASHPWLKYWADLG